MANQFRSWFGSRRKQPRSPRSSRALRLEPLEGRALLAADSFAGLERFAASWIDNEAAEISRFVSQVTQRTGVASGTSASSSAARAAGLVDDSYEENDTSSQASNLGTITAAKSIGNLVMADAHDWFRFQTTTAGDSASFVGINFKHAQGDLDLELWNSGGLRVGLTNGVSDGERISLAGLSVGSYYVHVYGYRGATNPNYTLNITPSKPLADDSYEENDTRATASDLGSLTAAKTISNLVMADANDWYRFQMKGSGDATNYVGIGFRHAQGDLDLELTDTNGTRLGLSDGVTDGERISLNGLAAGTYFVHVYGYQGAANPNYSLTINPGTNVTPPPPPPNTSGFHIDLTFAGLTANEQTIFRQAADRWSQVIVGDLPDATYNGRAVDDLLIDASATPIDGVGNILGQAGPDRFRAGTQLPYHGSMQFDTADIAQMEANGTLQAVIMHEMGHVLGIGTIWDTRGLLVGAGGSNPRFTGSLATAEYNTIFNRHETGVPVENSGGSGTRDSHWRESVFTNELMTGYIGPGNVIPLSRVTVASLADLGYQVNLTAADPFTPSPNAAAVASSASSSSAGNAGLRALPELRPLNVSPTSLPTPRTGALLGGSPTISRKAADAFFATLGTPLKIRG